MKRVTILLPEALYNEIKKLKEEGKIKSMSEFLRNLIAYAMHINGKERAPRVVIPRISVPIGKPRNEKPEEKGLIGYGKVHAELMQQLKQVLAIRRKRIMGDNDAGVGERKKNNTKEP